MKNGKGRFIMDDDTIIDSTFTNDIQTGECKITFPNGDEFKGMAKLLTFLESGTYRRNDGYLF